MDTTTAFSILLNDTARLVNESTLAPISSEEGLDHDITKGPAWVLSLIILAALGISCFFLLVDIQRNTADDSEIPRLDRPIFGTSENEQQRRQNGKKIARGDCQMHVWGWIPQDSDDHDDEESMSSMASTGTSAFSCNIRASSSQETMESLRQQSTLRANAPHSSTSSRLSCVICLSIFRRNQMVCESVRGECIHVFHVDCLKPWLDIDMRCPLCRVSFVTEVE